MTRIMRDSDTPTDIRIRGTDLVAGYVTGPGKWPVKAYARFRGIPVAHIDCYGTMPKKAEILDVEPGCTPSVHAAVTWVKKRKAAFPGAYPPIIYCNRDKLTPLRHAMNAAGLHLVQDFRLWIATLDGTKRLDDMTGVTAVQYADEGITGGHYDESIVYDDDWHPEDDMPYTKKQIRRYAGQGLANELKTDPATRDEIKKLVKRGVALELKNDTATRDEIKGLVKQGVADELQAAIAPGGLLDGIVQQVKDIHDHVIPPPPPPPTGTRPTPP